MYRRMRLDWRGDPDLTKPAELYSVGPYKRIKPIPSGNPQGRVLAAISATLLYGPDGSPAAYPLNTRLFNKALVLGAVTDRVLWKGENGYTQKLLDLTKRGMSREFLIAVREELGNYDGIHFDWFTAWSWAFPDLAPTDEAWDNIYGSLANALRADGKLVIGQQYHLTFPVMQSSGAFVEESPYANRYTLAMHEEDLGRYRGALKLFGDRREDAWVFEIRHWRNWPQASLDYVLAWAEAKGVYVSLGRDGDQMP